MKKADYRDSRWIKLRNKIFERDGRKCKYCGSEEKLNVHHLSYSPNLEIWEYEDFRLITLCEDCHNNVHATFDHIKSLLEKIQRQPDLIHKVPIYLGEFMRANMNEKSFL